VRVSAFFSFEIPKRIALSTTDKEGIKRIKKGKDKAAEKGGKIK